MAPVTKRTTIIEVLLLAFFVLAFRLAFEGAIPFFQNNFNLNFNETLSRLLGNYPLALSLIHISEPTRLLSISYAVFCLKKKNTTRHN